MTEPNNTEQTTNQAVPPDGAAPSPGKKPWSDFRKALVITVAPCLIFSIVLLIGPHLWTETAFIVAVLLPGLAIPAAITASVVFAVTGERESAAGTLAGLGIGIVAMGASCYASIAFSR